MLNAEDSASAASVIFAVFVLYSQPDVKTVSAVSSSQSVLSYLSYLRYARHFCKLWVAATCSSYNLLGHNLANLNGFADDFFCALCVMLTVLNNL